MQTYVKRGINAKVKDGTDLLTSVDSDDVTGSGQALGSTQQYEPYYSSSYSKVTTTKEESERAVNDGGEAKATSYRDYDVGSTEVTEGVQ
ncbi:MAG: hypothetical protein K9L61_00635 [Candidatus Omnitrophica bacterium]|nr:hypothetical protein [Candidatus Omnitrophota bacterium]